MSIGNTIKQKLVEKRHSNRYGDLRQVSETLCFEVVSMRNRFSNAYSGLKGSEATLYGSHGANGVVTIKTLRGNEN